MSTKRYDKRYEPDIEIKGGKSAIPRGNNTPFRLQAQQQLHLLPDEGQRYQGAYQQRADCQWKRW